MAKGSRLENLPPDKFALLNRLIRERTGGKDRIVRRPDRGSVIPASFGQTRIWFLDRLNPGSPVYQISAALREHGAMNADVLTESINIVISRHESLRTSFTETDGKVFQVIAPRLEIDVRVADFTALPADNARREASAFGTAEASAPFSLETGPLLRLALIRLDTENSIVLLTIHHIITDGWSMRVLLQELSIIYTAICKGEAPHLPELPIQYADYALWQRQRLTPEFLASELSYWRRQLEGAPRLQLPADYPSTKRTARGARELFSLGWARTRGLEAISAQSGATIFMVLLAAFQVLLGRYSDQDDIVIGTPVAGRNHPETEHLIGFLLNTICIRTSLAGNPSFFELLEQVRQTAIHAYAHQDIPFEKVVEELAPDRHLSDSALFNVMFVLQPRDGVRALNLADSSPSENDTGAYESGTAKFDLTLSMAETDEGLIAALEYSTDLFRPATARRIRDHFLTLIDSILAGLHMPINELSMLTAAEEEKIIRTWNDTAATFNEHTRIEQLIVKQAARVPDATAVMFEGWEISYRELCEQAFRTARYLSSQGIQRGDHIGIFLGRGRHLLPAILGAWCAGGVYVPMDVQSPPDRLRFMLEDADLACILTDERLATGIPRGTPMRVCLDREPALSEVGCSDAPDVQGSSSDPAYMIYTSGSTGQPKGVVVSHRSAVNYLTWINEVLVAGSSRRMPAITEITFDASFKQLVAPLLRGDAVWLLSENALSDFQHLAFILGSQGDFTLNCVPWLWSRLLEALSGEGVVARDYLKRLLLGGEALTSDLLERTFSVFPSVEVWNLYGPTEVTANATACRLVPGQPVSIGWPIANCVVRVLDSHGRLAPVGVPGELHLGGAGVALGYWNRPELTKKMFVTDPCSADPAARLYKTGDRVFFREDGALVYTGRIDRQIKLHGFRIEPGEIEAALRSHAGVKESQVEVTTIHGEQQLVACVEAKEGVALSRAELIQMIAGTLPSYMVPSRLVVVKEIPRGTHAKVDHGAMRSLIEENVSCEEKVIAPRDEFERGICFIWEAVLSCERLSIRSNFFALGGHSLLAMQVISRICQKFAVELPLRAIFEAPTIEGLAVMVRNSQPARARSTFAAIPRLAR
jgi:amino acid adenylation domain-containing protein